ncbi:MAG: amino acid racemase [Bacillota bacterium]|nr:amino acid racemase [Bacillota bacterium]
MKKLGVIGGMGPAATALFYQMIAEKTKAEKDQDHIPMVILSDCLMPDRTGAIMGSDDEKQIIHDKLLADAKVLKEQGCDMLAIPCNTCHYFADQVADDMGIELNHMLRLAAKECKRRTHEGAKVAILATEGTIKTGLYKEALEAENMQIWLPDEALQAKISSIIYDKVKAGIGICLADWMPIEDAVYAAECDCAVLGCTELSVVARELELEDFYVDAMDELAKSCVEKFNR